MSNHLGDYVSIRMHPSFREQFTEIAARKSCSLSEAIREALAQYLKEMQAADRQGGRQHVAS